MSVFICDWNDGTFGIADARNAEEATAMLDEFGSVEPQELQKLPSGLLLVEFSILRNRVTLSNIGGDFWSRLQGSKKAKGRKTPK